MKREKYPCDYNEGVCPYNASRGMDCYNFCGLGADESDILFEEGDEE